MTTKKKAILNVGLLLLTFLVNFLGASGFINGMSQADVSDKYHTLITPAGFTFSIWGLIYTLILVSVLWMVKNSERRSTKRLIESISPLFWFSLVSNMLWIVTFSFELIGLSTIFIFIYLLALLGILFKLKNLTVDGRWFFGISFGLNTGWLLIASMVNVAAFLVKMDWSGFGIGADVWAGLAIILSVVLAYILHQLTKNAVISLPISWAFFGIWQALGQQGDFLSLEILSILAILLTLFIAIRGFIKNGNRVLPEVIDDKNKF
jgi:hypothetical protein